MSRVAIDLGTLTVTDLVRLEQAVASELEWRQRDNDPRSCVVTLPADAIARKPAPVLRLVKR